MKTLTFATLFLLIQFSNAFAKESGSIPPRLEELALIRIQSLNAQVPSSGTAYQSLSRFDKEIVEQQLETEIRETSEAEARRQFADDITQRKIYPEIDTSIGSTVGRPFLSVMSKVLNIYIQSLQKLNLPHSERIEKANAYRRELEKIAAKYNLENASYNERVDHLDLIASTFRESYVHAMRAKGRGDESMAKEFSAAAYRLLIEGYLNIATTTGGTKFNYAAARTQMLALLFTSIPAIPAAAMTGNKWLLALPLATTFLSMIGIATNDLRSNYSPLLVQTRITPDTKVDPLWPKFLIGMSGKRRASEKLMEAFQSKLTSSSLFLDANNRDLPFDPESEKMWGNLKTRVTLEELVTHLTQLSGLNVDELANYKFESPLSIFLCGRFYKGN